VNYPASRFWHLVYNTSSADMATALSLSRSRHAGWVYVTDDLMTNGFVNPWDTLATYWSSEVANVAAAAGCAGGGNLIQNCDFASGMTSWSCDFGGGSAGTCSVVSGQLQTVITNPGTATYHVQPKQVNLALTQNRTYTVSFDARASVARPMTISVSMNHTPWSSYSSVRTFNLTTSMATYSFTFTMTQPADANVKLEFGFGANGSNTVYVDNVAIR
ncbi:MAG TPA: carbohydrate binding domain-containing protein, partial [Polyangiaceae bacterium]